MGSDRGDVASPHTTRLLGDPAVHVVLSCGTSDQPPARIVGVWTRLWENTLAGRGTVRALKLKPGAAGALLPDASRVQNRVVPISECVAQAPSVCSLSLEDAGDEEAFARLARWARTHLQRRPATAAAIEACARVDADPTLLRVAQLASELGRSERTLQKLFRVHVGASPKFVIRRRRLQEAAVRLERGDDASIADLAYRLGYADQAHFSRDWKAAVSMSARVFARSVHE